jgi:hypothetical protein
MKIVLTSKSPGKNTWCNLFNFLSKDFGEEGVQSMPDSSEMRVGKRTDQEAKTGKFLMRGMRSFKA